MREGGQLLGHLLHHALEHPARDLGAAVALGQGDDADRQRIPGADPQGRVGGRVGAPRRRARRSRWSRRRCRRSRRIPPSGSASAAQPVTARYASVWRSTISRSRPTPRRTRSTKAAPFTARRQASVAITLARLHAAGLHLGPADPQRLDGALDRRLAQAVRGPEPLAEADDARERVDDPEAAEGRLGDQQAAIVGAEIERRVGRRDGVSRPGDGGRRAGAARRRPGVGTARPRRSRPSSARPSILRVGRERRARP